MMADWANALRDFMDDVTALTGGDVTFEVLPARGAVSLFPQGRRA